MHWSWSRVTILTTSVTPTETMDWATTELAKSPSTLIHPFVQYIYICIWVNGWDIYLPMETCLHEVTDAWTLKLLLILIETFLDEVIDAWTLKLLLTREEGYPLGYNARYCIIIYFPRYIYIILFDLYLFRLWRREIRDRKKNKWKWRLIRDTYGKNGLSHNLTKCPSTSIHPSIWTYMFAHILYPYVNPMLYIPFVE